MYMCSLNHHSYWCINQVWLALEPGAVSTSSIGSSAASSPSSPTMCSPCNAAFWPGHQLLCMVGSIDIEDIFSVQYWNKGFDLHQKRIIAALAYNKNKFFSIFMRASIKLSTNASINGQLDAYYSIPMT